MLQGDLKQLSTFAAMLTFAEKNPSKYMSMDVSPVGNMAVMVLQGDPVQSRRSAQPTVATSTAMCSRSPAQSSPTSRSMWWQRCGSGCHFCGLFVCRLQNPWAIRPDGCRGWWLLQGHGMLMMGRWTTLPPVDVDYSPQPTVDNPPASRRLYTTACRQHSTAACQQHYKAAC